LLSNFAVDFVEICNVYVGKMIIKAAKRIFNFDKICRSYSDLNFGVTFLKHSVLVQVDTVTVREKFVSMTLRTRKVDETCECERGL